MLDIWKLSVQSLFAALNIKYLPSSLLLWIFQTNKYMYKWFMYANCLTGYATFACIQLLINIVFVIMVDFIESINVIYASNFIFKPKFTLY